MIAVAFEACGKRTCSPDSYSYENQVVYGCFSEHAPSTGTKKRLIFECKKEAFYPLNIAQVVNHSGGTKTTFENFTCLDSEGNIELVRYPYGASLYCVSEKAGQWKEVFL